jgi:hypothetical protein
LFFQPDQLLEIVLVLLLEAAFRELQFSDGSLVALLVHAAIHVAVLVLLGDAVQVGSGVQKFHFQTLRRLLQFLVLVLDLGQFAFEADAFGGLGVETLGRQRRRRMFFGEVGGHLAQLGFQLVVLVLQTGPLRFQLVQLGLEGLEFVRFHPELLFGAVNVEERRHPDEEPPPRPIPDHEKLPDVPLDAADGEILEFALGEAATGEVPPAVGLQVDDHAGETLVPLGLQLRQHPITEKYLTQADPVTGQFQVDGQQHILDGLPLVQDRTGDFPVSGQEAKPASELAQRQKDREALFAEADSVEDLTTSDLRTQQRYVHEGVFGLAEAGLDGQGLAETGVVLR